MLGNRDIPWTGLILAGLAGIGIWLAGVNLIIVLLVTVTWMGSLWISIPPPEPLVSMDPNQMKLSHDGMRDLIENSGLPLMLLDRRRVLMANAAARDVLGSHILGQDARVAVRHPEAVELLEERRRGSVTISGLSTPRSIWQLSSHPVDDRYCMVELINRSAEADISRAHTDFVANASHELRTPLASIIGYVETLTEDGGDVAPETRQRFLMTVLREARRLQTLVNDLMSLSRVEAEKHDQPSEKIDLVPLVKQAARDGAGSQRVERLQIDVADEPLNVRGDYQQLEQLVRNLVDNALKYGAADQPVTVTLKPGAGNLALFSVADRGEGIAPEHLPHLTRRFYRTDPGRSRAAGGTGLGLAIVKHIVERHRGRMDIDSKLGQGTTVSVKFPLMGQETA